MAVCGDQEELHGLAAKDATPVVQTDHLVRGDLHTMPCSPSDRLISHTASDGANEPQSTYNIHTSETADNDVGIYIGGYNPDLPNNAPGSIDIRHTIETGDTDCGIVFGIYNTDIHVQKNATENAKAGNRQTIATVEIEPCIYSDKVNAHQTDDTRSTNNPNSIDNALGPSRQTSAVDISATSTLGTMDGDSHLMEESESMPQRPMTYGTPLEINADYGDGEISMHPGLEMECETPDIEEAPADDDHWDDSQPSPVKPTVCSILDHSYGVPVGHGDVRALQCHHCGLVFRTPELLTTHLREHFTDNEFHCDRCCESPANNARPSIENRRDDVGRESCSQCGKLVVGVPSKQTCKHCGVTYTPRCRVRKHKCLRKYVKKHRLKLKSMRKAVRMVGLKCKVCGKQFTKTGFLKLHLRIHNKPDSCEIPIGRRKTVRIGKYECEVCGMHFTKSTSLKLHSRIHKHPDNCKCPICTVEYKCEVCGKRFTMENSLKVHARIHTDKDHRKCHVCGKVLSHPSSLLGHMRIHSDRERDTICKVCNKGFTDKKGLKTHMVFHEEKKFSCEYCGKLFHRKPTLARHIQSHSSVKAHQCEKCGSRFTRGGALKTHMMVVHDGVKNLVCEYCEKAFATKRDLSRHTRTHTGERPFLCTQCDKTFKQKPHLNTHVRIHTRDRPFSCTECSEAFTDVSSLNDHFRNHTGDH